jgi:hypothetical protein
MSAWELILSLTVIVSLSIAWHYKNLASRMKMRARVYIQYVPRDQLTKEERVVFDNFKKDVGIK